MHGHARDTHVLICLRAHGDHPALFSGDTLFNAGAGNCHNGGNPEDLYATFADQLAKLPENTKIYPGHDYIENNLKFTLAREPDNSAARDLLPKVAGHDPATSIVTTLAQEKHVNTFMRLTSASVIATLRQSFPDLPERPDAKSRIRQAAAGTAQQVVAPKARAHGPA